MDFNLNDSLFFCSDTQRSFFDVHEDMYIEETSSIIDNIQYLYDISQLNINLKTIYTKQHYYPDNVVFDELPLHCIDETDGIEDAFSNLDYTYYINHEINYGFTDLPSDDLVIFKEGVNIKTNPNTTAIFDKLSRSYNKILLYGVIDNSIIEFLINYEFDVYLIENTYVSYLSNLNLELFMENSKFTLLNIDIENLNIIHDV